MNRRQEKFTRQEDPGGLLHHKHKHKQPYRFNHQHAGDLMWKPIQVKTTRFSSFGMRNIWCLQPAFECRLSQIQLSAQTLSFSHALCLVSPNYCYHLLICTWTLSNSLAYVPLQKSFSSTALPLTASSRLLTKLPLKSHNFPPFPQRSSYY